MSARSSSPFDPYKVTENGLYLRDNTIANVSTTKHGLTPKLSGNATEYLNGAGGYTVPPGTGGSAAYQVLDPFMPDASPHALNQEFTSSSLGVFTTVYTGDAGVTIDAATTVPKGLYIEATDNQYHMKSVLQALPGDTNWTIHACATLGTRTLSSSFISTAGIVLSDGTATSGTKQATTAIITQAGGVTRARHFWQNFGNGATGASTADMLDNFTRTCFLRFRLNSGTYFWGWSVDNVLWDEVSAAPGFTPTHFGLTFQNYSSTTAACWFPYLRYYATGAVLRTGRSVYVYH